MGVLLGIGLGAACGFRVLVPLLVASIAIHGGFLTVTPEFAWLGGTPALITLSIATLLEIAGYYLPVIDNTLDVLERPPPSSRAPSWPPDSSATWIPCSSGGLAAIAAGRSGGRHSWQHGRPFRAAASAATGGLGQFRGLHGGNGIRLPRLHPGLHIARSGRPPAGSGHLPAGQVRHLPPEKETGTGRHSANKVEVQDERNAMFRPGGGENPLKP